MPKAEAIRQIQHAVMQIPSGRVASYGQIADLAGLPGRARMVGRALRLAAEEQPLPWHRVVRADGKLAFPAGSDSANEQRERLVSEGIPVVNNRVAMSQWRWEPDIYELLHKLKY
ncbi:cysteine methyltransferase [Alteromonas aestuariivivens]|uniref:Cysteine methyltransferase n=1 Tax=Alteromonas aestuariivivens TaxID=1938339 RepID=A0A3D8M5C4_9ALTE|nr:MGMT family protein [Alteromonas aestuariivivens]RDV24808.1 cysteine methyltransferase [Alteromonas aestuariivivens]